MEEDEIEFTQLVEEFENDAKELKEIETIVLRNFEERVSPEEKYPHCIHFVEKSCKTAGNMKTFLKTSKGTTKNVIRIEKLLDHRLQRLDEVFQKAKIIFLKMDLALQIIEMYSEFGMIEKVVEYSILYARTFIQRRSFSKEFNSRTSEKFLEDWKTLFNVISTAVKNGGKQLIGWNFMNRVCDYISQMKTIDAHQEAFGHVESILQELHTGMYKNCNRQSRVF